MLEGRGACFETACRVLGVSCWACLEVASCRVVRVACFGLRVARVGRVGCRSALLSFHFPWTRVFSMLRVARVPCAACQHMRGREC